jgi:hypothetical protein
MSLAASKAVGWRVHAQSLEHSLVSNCRLLTSNLVPGVGFPIGHNYQKPVKSRPSRNALLSAQPVQRNGQTSSSRTGPTSRLPIIS